MNDASPIKIPLFARRAPLPALPDQPSNTTFFLVWGQLPMPQNGMCYIAESVKGGKALIHACITNSGFVYRVDQPVDERPAGEPDLAIAKKTEEAGGIYIKTSAGDLARIGMYDGSVKGTLTERGTGTWNAEHGTKYREFMATLFLHYCEFSPDAAVEQIDTMATVDELDTTFGQLEEPVELFAGYETLTLPDAIAATLYRINEKMQPCGLEVYARSVLAPIDLNHLRTLAASARITLSRIERSSMFFVNFDRAKLEDDEVAFIFSVEAALNRISTVLDGIGAQMEPVTNSPSEAACLAIERTAFLKAVSQISAIIDGSTERNPWAQLGTVACRPGGEWDVRTRFVHACEGLNLIARLEYSFQYHPDIRELRVSFAPPLASSLPAVLYDPAARCARPVSERERAVAAAEYGARMAVVLGAAGFSSGLSIETCVIELRAFAGLEARAYSFNRAAFLAETVPFALGLQRTPLLSQATKTALEAFRTEYRELHDDDDVRFLVPREDGRPLPSPLRDLLLADTARDLEVMELPNDLGLVRLAQLRALMLQDPHAASEGISELIERLQAGCVAAEVVADGPVASLYSENYLCRMLMGLCYDDPTTRINRVPDALFNAQYELANMYSRNDDYEHALPEARKLLDMAPTSSSAHFAVINVLAHLNIYEEVIEVVRHGLQYSFDRDTTAYYFYRMAFAYWSIGKNEVALACYRAIPRGESISETADEEMRALMANMGRTDQPTFPEAMAALTKEGIPVPPTSELTNLMADAAVQLTDAGFFFLASHCVFHLWRTLGNDDLSALHRSLM